MPWRGSSRRDYRNVGDTAEVLDHAKEALDEVTSSIEALSKAGFPFAIGFGPDVGHRALLFVQVADAIGVIGLVGQDDGARSKSSEQPVWREFDLPIVQ